MTDVVDASYFDYLLHKLLQLYLDGGGQDLRRIYCRLASEMDAMFKERMVKYKRETCLKGMILKLLQVCQSSEAARKCSAERMLSYHESFELDWEWERDADYNRLASMVLLTYTHVYRENINKENKQAEDQSQVLPRDIERLKRIAGIAGEFSLSAVVEQCRAIKVGEPTLCEFAKERIRNLATGV